MGRGLGSTQREVVLVLGETGNDGLLPREVRKRIVRNNRPNLRKSIRRLEERDLLEWSGERLRLTSRGRLVAVGLSPRDEPDPLEEQRMRRREWDEFERWLRQKREEELHRWREEEDRWEKPGYECWRFPSKNQLRVIAALVRHATDPQQGLPAPAVRKIASIGDKSNARRAERALLARGTVQRSKDGKRLRIPSAHASHLWSFAPDVVDPPLDDAKAEAVLKGFGEWAEVVE